MFSKVRGGARPDARSAEVEGNEIMAVRQPRGGRAKQPGVCWTLETCKTRLERAAQRPNEATQPSLVESCWLAHAQFDYRAVRRGEFQKLCADRPVLYARSRVEVPVAGVKYGEQAPGLFALEQLEPQVKLAVSLSAKHPPQHRVGELRLLQHGAGFPVLYREGAELLLQRARLRLFREQILAHLEVVLALGVRSARIDRHPDPGKKMKKLLKNRNHRGEK